MKKERGLMISIGVGIFAIAVVTLVCAGIVRRTPWESESVAEATMEPEATIVPTLVPEVPLRSPEAEEPDTEDESPEADTKSSKKSEKTAEVSNAKNEKPKLSFHVKKGLEWPVSGTVKKEYSDEKPVYFATLKQYRTNPAILIESPEGTNVKASADGQVVMTDKRDETGMTVTIYHGDDYTTVYGQLKDVAVKKGDFVTAGDIIGKVAKPTATYCEEGEHLFFQLKKKGNPVNPNRYLDK